MEQLSSTRRRLAGVVVGVGLIASACSANSVPDDPAAQAANEAATASLDTLAQSSNVLDTEVLAVADGSVSTLRAVADGDRPILLWFWAPH